MCGCSLDLKLSFSYSKERFCAQRKMAIKYVFFHTNLMSYRPHTKALVQRAATKELSLAHRIECPILIDLTGNPN